MRKLPYLIIGTLILTFIATEVINIYLLNSIATDSIYVSQMQDQIRELREENTSIQTQILQQTSIATLSTRARKLGFVDAKEFISLYSPLQVALTK